GGVAVRDPARADRLGPDRGGGRSTTPAAAVRRFRWGWPASVSWSPASACSSPGAVPSVSGPIAADAVAAKLVEAELDHAWGCVRGVVRSPLIGTDGVAQLR